MNFFNPLDVNKWRNLLDDFDFKRRQFFENLAVLKRQRGVTPELEDERKRLLNQSISIEKDINLLMSTANTVRGLISNLGKTFGLGNTQDTLQGLGLAPVVLVVGIGGAAVIVKSITDWLTKTSAYAARNEQARILAEAGATPDQIIDADKRYKQSSAKIFGFDVRWLLAIGALVLAGPFVINKLQERL